MECRLACSSREFVQSLAEMQIVLSKFIEHVGNDVRLARMRQGSIRAQ